MTTTPETKIIELQTEIEVARRVLIAEFIPLHEQAAVRQLPLREIVRRACNHHDWHHRQAAVLVGQIK